MMAYIIGALGGFTPLPGGRSGRRFARLPGAALLEQRQQDAANQIVEVTIQAVLCGCSEHCLAAMITLAPARTRLTARRSSTPRSLRSKPSSSKHFRSCASLRTAYTRPSSPVRAYPPRSAPSDNVHEPMSRATIKHAAPAAHTGVRLCADIDVLHLEVQDRSPGFELDDVRGAWDCKICAID